MANGYLILDVATDSYFTHFDSRMRPHFSSNILFPRVYFSKESALRAVHKITNYLGSLNCELAVVSEDPVSAFCKINNLNEEIMRGKIVFKEKPVIPQIPQN